VTRAGSPDVEEIAFDDGKDASETLFSSTWRRYPEVRAAIERTLPRSDLLSARHQLGEMLWPTGGIIGLFQNADAKERHGFTTN
jgi:hypothetical protein